MRDEREMLELIVGAARADERVRAVILNGSRADPDVPRDPFQDFDVVYLVTDVESVKSDPGWIDRFGERMILQLPDDMLDPPPAPGDRYAYLMQFTDGNRIDLTLYPVARLPELPRDSLSLLLVDKDGLIEPFAPPSDRDYLPRPPTAKAFADCCNEFWWVCPYVAKGLWRGQITYAKHHLDVFVREQLMKMLGWYAGVTSGFTRGPGKFGRDLERRLAPEPWAMLLRSFAGADLEDNWEALFAAGELFRVAAARVAEDGGFAYPVDEDRRVSAHLRHVRSLPRNASRMYRAAGPLEGAKAHAR